ncbi:MAG: WavE lipopolysaccharide synthesis family protein [bacterium]|nr:WavE lipopolysaccharide synthesis family protein [bacterium]
MPQHVKKFLPATLKENVKSFGYGVADSLLHIVETLMGTFFSFYGRPIYADSIWIDQREAARDYSEYAIVMQGPIQTRNNFTLESLKLYKKYFNNALIILSTWEGEDAHTLNGAREIGVEVLLNKMPAPGLFNVNLQLTTARAGLALATKMNKKYSLKTRTDQRIYNRKSLTFLSNLLKDFPLPAIDSKQSGRLIALGAYDYATKPKLYHVYDNLIFGYTEDVLLYFGADFVSDKPVIEFLKSRYPDSPFTAEIYFFTEFLKKVGHTLAYTPEDYGRSLATHCILLDPRSLGWYWYKYFRFTQDQNMSVTYRNRTHLGFVEWLNLYNSYQQDKGSKNCCLP